MPHRTMEFKPAVIKSPQGNFLRTQGPIFQVTDTWAWAVGMENPTMIRSDSTPGLLQVHYSGLALFTHTHKGVLQGLVHVANGRICLAGIGYHFQSSKSVLTAFHLVSYSPWYVGADLSALK